MKRISAILCAVALFEGCLWNASGRLGSDPTVEDEDRQRISDWTLVTSPFKVVKVVSGDTLLVEYPIAGRLETIKVKLLGVDAPDKTPTITEYQGLSAFAMVVIALDSSTRSPELLNLADRDFLEERITWLFAKKKIGDIRFSDVRLLDDNWEMRMNVSPFIPLRAGREWDTESRQWKVTHLYAYVYCGKLFLNRFLIEEGFAKLDRSAVFDQRDAFEQSEERARRRRVGVWGLQ